MTTRNTLVLQQIIEALGDQLPAPEYALARFEEHFQDSFLIVSEKVTQVAEYAGQLCFAITNTGTQPAPTGLGKVMINQLNPAVLSAIKAGKNLRWLDHPHCYSS